MAPIILQPHSCGYCEKIVLDRSNRSRSKRNRGRRDGTNHDHKTEANVLFDFNFSHLVEASDHGCRLCSWILDEECITLKNAEAQCSRIPNLELRAVMAQSMMWTPKLIPSFPSQSIRSLARETPKQFEHMCLFLGARDAANIKKIEFFGLWQPVNKQITYRTRRGFWVQASEGDCAAPYITTRPIDDAPGSLETAAKVSSWRDRCLTEHNGSCPIPSAAFLPKRLIQVKDSNGLDCVRLCDTSQLACSSYIPLSYCWGKQQTTTLTKDSIIAWKESIPYDQLSKTVQDAIIVCRNLKVKFLWVDALCIIQDDDRDRSQQIAQMPEIYRNGYVTIAVASANDASVGFLHKRSSPNMETPAFVLPYVTPRHERGSVTIFSLDAKTSPLDSRAWTFQERLLSPRMLEFSDYQVRWVCRGAQNDSGWTNGWIVNPENNIITPGMLPEGVFERVFQIAQSATRDNDDKMPKETKLDWYRLVRSYTYRNLTRPTDRILALSGLAKLYSAALDDEYVSGLWRKSLLKELLWTVEKPTHPAPNRFQGPSWSWTSVNGVIDFKGQYGFEDEDRAHAKAKILRCEPVLVEESAPYGAVEEFLSDITLEARLLPALLLPQKSSNSYDIVDESYVLALKMSEDGKSQQIKVEIDTSDLATRMAEGTSSSTEVMLLELFSGFMESQWRSRGLLLRSEFVPRRQEDAIKQRLAVEEKKGDEKIHDSRPELRQEAPTMQTAALRYQIRRYLGAEVDDWSSEQVLNYSQTKGGDLLRMRRKENVLPEPKPEPEPEDKEQVFFRIGMYDYTSNFWSQADYDNRAQRECDWFKYCVPRIVKIS